MKKIVLTTDFSECAKAAIPTAVELTKNLPAQLTILHVLPVAVPYPWENGPRVFSQEERAYNFKDLEEKASLEMDKWIGKLEIPFEKVILEGYPPEQILQYLKAKLPDMVVIGTHGYSNPKRFLLGSVAHYLVHEAPCPVVTIKMATP